VPEHLEDTVKPPSSPTKASALKALYATLSPDQQGTFNRETMPPAR